MSGSEVGIFTKCCTCRLHAANNCGILSVKQKSRNYKFPRAVFLSCMLLERLKILMSIHGLIYKAELTHILRSIIDAILLCDKQGISHGGHHHDSTVDPSTNRGNFVSILEALADRDSILNEHLDTCKNAWYTS